MLVLNCFFGKLDVVIEGEWWFMVDVSYELCMLLVVIEMFIEVLC